jgi:serine/threonine protein phosphatase 1
VSKLHTVQQFLEIEQRGGRIYAIGDIHGALPEIEVLLSHLSSTTALSKDDTIIFIGDYIDRGPDSKGVIDLLIKFKQESSANIHFLRGNHEEMLLDYLGLGGAGEEVYIQNGGSETFLSYGLPAEPTKEAALEIIPAEHIKFYQNLERYIITDKFVFAHAGLNPLRDLRFQTDDDIFWIRDEFIQNLHYFKKTIVFGHTPFEDVMFHLPYKIGIDTGLIYGNALTAIEIKDEQVIQIPTGTKEVEVFTFKQKGGLWPKFG